MGRTTNRDIKIMGGGVLNYCDKTTKRYLNCLKTLEGNELENTEAYRLLNNDIEAIVEFYRIILLESFGKDYILSEKYKSLEVILDYAIKYIEPVIEEVRSLDSSGINSILFIQGCLSFLQMVTKRW